MPEAPAETIRRAVAQLRDPVFCGDRATPAIADWLDGEAENARSAFQQPDGSWEMPRFGSVTSALKVARAYLGETEADLLRADAACALDDDLDGGETKAEPFKRPRGCICIMFRDTGGFRIADLTCPVHGVGGTEPGDSCWEAS